MVTKSNATSSPAPTSRTTGRRFSIATQVMGERDFFGMPAMVFVNEVLNSEVGKSTALKVSPVQTVPPSATIMQILEVMVTSGHHRVFLTDPETKQALGLISVSDICKLIWIEVDKEIGKSSVVKPPPIPTRKPQPSNEDS